MFSTRFQSEMNKPVPPTLSTVLRLQGNVLVCSFAMNVFSVRFLSVFSVNYLLTASFTTSEPHSDLIANYAVSTSLVTLAVRERLRSRLAARRYTGVISYL